MFKKYKSLFSLMTSVCSFSVWRQKLLSPQDLKNASELNILTLWDNWPVHVHMLQYFFFIRRNFWSSLEVLQTLFFLIFFFILHGIIYQYKILLCVIYTMLNKQTDFYSGKIFQISQVSFFKFCTHEISDTVCD